MSQTTSLPQTQSETASATSINNNDADPDNFFDQENAPRLSPFQSYWEDQSKVNPKNKLKLLFCAAASGAVDGFSLNDLGEEPFKDQPGIRPAREVLRDEIKRRDPQAKTIVRHSVKELMVMMTNTNNLLTPECQKFIYEKFAEVKAQFQKSIE